MILRTLRLKNFRQYPDFFLEFRDGLVGITGKNGAGKSTLFDAMIICLYGEKGNKHGYRTRSAGEKEPVELELEFEAGAKSYRVLREFRGKNLAHKASLYDSSANMIATGAREVSEAVSDLLGLDREAFSRSVFSGQKELDEISRSTKEERKKMIRRMLGLEKLDEIQKKIREDGRDLNNQGKGKRDGLLPDEEEERKKTELEMFRKEIAEYSAEHVKTKRSLELAETLYSNCKLALAKSEATRNSFLELEKKRISIRQLLKNLSEQLEKSILRRTNLQARVLEIESELPRLSAFENLKAEKVRLDEFKIQSEKRTLLVREKEQLQSDFQTISSEISAFESNLSKLPDAAKQIVLTESELKTLEEKLTTLDLEIGRKQSEAGEIEGKIRERNEQLMTIRALGKNADCPTCLRPLFDSYDSTVKKLSDEIMAFQQRELARIETELSAGKNARKQVKEEEKTLRERNSNLGKEKIRLLEFQKQKSAKEIELLQLKKRMDVNLGETEKTGHAQFDHAGYDILLKNLKSEELFVREHQRKAGEVGALPELVKEIQELNGRIAKGKEILREESEKIEGLGFSEAEFADVRKKTEQAEKSRDEARNLELAMKEKLSQAEREKQSIEMMLKQKESALAEIRELEILVMDLTRLDLLFDRFKSAILDEVRVPISVAASELFRQITSGKYDHIRADQDFMFEILDDGKYYPISEFSGGETDLANLCLRIAISRAISALNDSSEATGFLAFDEIFGSQDEDRRGGILHALDILKEQYRQIYIISHIESVNESFPNILHVNLEGGISSARWTGP